MARWRFRHYYITADHDSRFFLLSNSYKSQDENGNTFLRILLPLDEVVKHLVSPLLPTLWYVGGLQEIWISINRASQ